MSNNSGSGSGSGKNSGSALPSSGRFPPPPRMTTSSTAGSPPPPSPRQQQQPSSSRSRNSRNSNNDLPQQPPHSVAAQLPRLESAPPSATNLNLLGSASDEWMQSANEQWQSAVDVLGGVANALSSSASFPTPSTLTTNSSILPQPTVAPLPPPPPMPTTTSSTSSMSTTRAAVAVAATAAAKSSLAVQVEQQPTQPGPPTEMTVSQQPAQIQGQRPPPALPRTHFLFRSIGTGASSGGGAPKSSSTAPPLFSVTARRQECIPVLLLATEAAHKLAWKNGLQLQDLLQGFAVSNANTNMDSSSSNPLPPFRSATRQLALQWSDVRLQFGVGDQSAAAAATDAQAAAFLQQAALLQPQDGNLAQELELLEDQVDNLLPSVHDEEEGSNCYNQDNSSQHQGGGGGGGNHDISSGDIDELEGRNSSSNHQHHYSHGMLSMVEQQKRQEQVHKDAFSLTSPMNIPWLRRYRLAADAATELQPHELFACPAVVLSVCTTQEEDYSNPMDCLRTLHSSPYYLPAAYRNGLYDPSAIRHEVLVLHDNVAGPQQWDETMLRQQLVRAFGAASTVLRLNSLDPQTAAVRAAEETADLWGGGGQLGNCLTVADAARVRKWLQHLVVTAVLPALERRISDLNAIVSDRKKGVKNVLKSFWGTARNTKKDDDETAAAAASSQQSVSTTATAASNNANDVVVKYRYDSIESQTRLLADTLFLVRDYDAAYSVYRLIKDDFKHDRNWIHYAAVHEMMALSLYMTDRYGRAKEIFSSIENALLSYSRAAEEEAAQSNTWGDKVSGGRATAAPVATRLATRLCLVLTLMHNICSGRHLEVADLLASASSHETALGAAVLLEQSSAHYYHAEMYRKYAFHMLMSGHMFRSAEQEHHAFRCFTSSLYIYRDGRWEELHNHLRSALAAQLFSMGRMAIALQLYAKLVGSTEGGRVSVKSQQKFVHNLLEICNEHNKKALVGADRMTAPAKLSGAQRDAFRKEQLDRIVQVIRYTKSASRVLELPNVELPRVDDASVVVIAEEASHQEKIPPSLGEAATGSEELWDDLTLRMTAELRATDTSLTLGDKIVVNKALRVIEDPEIRRVVALMEMEKLNRTKAERMKRSASYKDSAPVRALKEPIAVQFTLTNPLAIPIDLCDLQLVARMKSESGEGVCTNEGAVTIRPLVASNEKQTWTFQSSDIEFELAEFCRVSSGRGDSERDSWKSAEDVEPYFVVTKTDLTLEPESQRTVSASICPLVLGSLEVVGMRCRLLDDVWVYHPFDIKGPLLQNTRSNRANRVRGESFLLKSYVERGMPCLTVDLVEATPTPNDTVLQSQVGEYVLRVTNVGTASASKLTLKTNVPWLNILDPQGQDGDEKRAASHCIGPTGTLMAIPLEGSSLHASGQIQPGESLDVPVEIKTTGVGKQNFYMLFRYELQDDANLPSPRCRWLKKMFVVPVYPSLTLSAAISPAFSAKSEHILSVELTNCRTDRPDQLELDLNELTLASRYYRLESLPGQIMTSSSSSTTVTLGWQERATFHYKLVCKDGKDPPSLLSHCPFAGVEEVNEATRTLPSSLLAFLCLERAHDSFEEAMKQHQMALARAAAHGDDRHHPRSISSIRRANTDLSMSESAHSSKGADLDRLGHWASVARLCPLDDNGGAVHIMCSWSGLDSTFRGTHHFRGLAVRPPANSRECPITLTASHPSNVSNDFENGPANVPLKVTLKNRIDTPVDLEFAIVAPVTFDFTGPETYRTKLNGGEELSIPLKALLPSAGVYNLQRVRLSVEQLGSSPSSYRFPLQWMVTANPM